MEQHKWLQLFGQWRLQNPKFKVILGSMVNCSQHGLPDPFFQKQKWGLGKEQSGEWRQNMEINLGTQLFKFKELKLSSVLQNKRPGLKRQL